MSFFPGQDPEAGDKYQCDAIKTVIVPRSVDLGDGFTVRRALPHPSTRRSGRSSSSTISARPCSVPARPRRAPASAYRARHRHLSIRRRDHAPRQPRHGLPIRPGDVNWMTAGRGIVHSERTGPERRGDGEPLHGLQLWVGAAGREEEIDAGFRASRARRSAAMVADDGMTRAHGRRLRSTAQRSPLQTSSDTLFADAHLEAGSALPFDAEHEERAIYIIAGEIEIAGDKFGGRAASGVPAGRPHHHHAPRPSALRADRRRAARWPASHLVEFRLLAQGPHRAGQGRMEGQAALTRCRATRSSSSRCRRIGRIRRGDNGLSVSRASSAWRGRAAAASPWRGPPTDRASARRAAGRC